MTPAEAQRPTGSPGVLDTSVFIARETGRPLRSHLIPPEVTATVITYAELSAGALAASDPAQRAKRLRTLTEASSLPLLEVNIRAAECWAQLHVHLGQSDRRLNVNDLWIAAIALAHGLPVVSHDDDFAVLDDFPDLTVIRV